MTKKNQQINLEKTLECQYEMKTNQGQVCFANNITCQYYNPKKQVVINSHIKIRGIPAPVTTGGCILYAQREMKKYYDKK